MGRLPESKPSDSWNSLTKLALDNIYAITNPNPTIIPQPGKNGSFRPISLMNIDQKSSC
jgi:hypothetical protein